MQKFQPDQSTKFKVLYVSANGYLGGAERFVLTACHAHQNSGKIEASILFFKNGEAVELAKKMNISCHVLSSVFKLKNPLQLWKSLCEIRAFVKQSRPKIVHNTMPYTHIVMGLALAGLSFKKVWFQHGPVGGLLDKIASIFPSHLLIFNSSYLKKEHDSTTWFHRTSDEMILKLGINSGEKRNKPIFSDEIIKLGTSGRICDWKGFHNVIYAIHEMMKSNSLRPFIYTIAGSPKSEKDNLYFESLKKMVKEFSLQEKINFLGHQEQLNSFYNNTDVFIHASTIAEPFGLVAAEALAQGCLVIGSDTGGVSDILKNQTTALTFNSVSPQAVHELTKVLLPILNAATPLETEKYRTIALRGSQFIKQEYTIDSMIKELEERYLRL